MTRLIKQLAAMVILPPVIILTFHLTLFIVTGGQLDILGSLLR